MSPPRWSQVVFVVVVSVCGLASACSRSSTRLDRGHLVLRTRAARTARAHIRLTIAAGLTIEGTGVVDFGHHSSTIRWSFGELGAGPIDETRIGRATFIRVPGDSTTGSPWIAGASPAGTELDIESVLDSSPHATSLTSDRAGRVNRVTVVIDNVIAELELTDYGGPPPIAAPPPSSVVRG